MRLLVTAAAHDGADYLAMIEQVRPECPALHEVVVIGQDSWRRLIDLGGRLDHHQLDERQDTLGCDDPINIQYTSGTTGFPKGATLSHHNILNNGYFVTERIAVTEVDRLCIPVPFYHCFGMVMGSDRRTSHGAAVVFPSPAFDPGRR